MREQHVGYLVVVGPKVGVDSGLVPIGVLTDRDIVVGVVAKETDPKALRVGDLMTRQPVVVDENTLEPVGRARLRQFRPCRSGQGRPVGTAIRSTGGALSVRRRVPTS
jgi:CBS domain-containing protein